MYISPLIKDFVRKYMSAELIDENDYLKDEVKRLRAQVALHIDTKPIVVCDCDLIQSVHVMMVPWCQCCAARVPIDHVCSCELNHLEDDQEDPRIAA